ncbi:MAG: 3-carboxy-cis,cis-muconate cycloisomerase [Acidobacteriaceae bacterium]|jgi:3-carboxy-cis,cis-muconate cycloisomerase|nr:3-carboxy-cis,cis-muconate cycloisomerase [Acidobacteriaceae bacterium]
MNLFDPIFRCEPIAKLFRDDNFLQRMLDFEAALAAAEATSGVIPSFAANVIAAKCRVELFDKQQLAEAAALAGNLAIPVVKQLKALIASENKDVAGFVHWGATSQDATDTALVLQLREALDLISADIEKLCDALAQMADRHRLTPIVARTLMQHAIPTTLGMKFAGWLDVLMRHRERFREMQKRCLVLQFGGAAGTLAALGAQGPVIAKHLSEQLKLPLPQIPWHSHRDRLSEIATTLGLLTGTLGKISQDIALHMQTEIDELREPAEENRGGSSTMPHKRNPVACAIILAAATRVPGIVATMLSAMLQQDERGLGGWHAEWETLPEIVCLSAGALHHLANVVPRLEIDVNRMSENLNLTKGLIFTEAINAALGEKISRSQARDFIDAASQRAIKEKRHLRDVINDDQKIAKHLSSQELDSLFDPRNYTGSSSEFIDRVLENHKSQKNI